MHGRSILQNVAILRSLQHFAEKGIGTGADVIQKQFNVVIIDIALISHKKHVCIF